MHWPALRHGGKRLKPQASFGYIEHAAAVIPFQLQKCKFVRHLSEFLASIEVYVFQVHVFFEAFLIFGMAFKGGMKACRIGGPRVGVGPGLLASRGSLYSLSPRLKVILAATDSSKFSAPAPPTFFQPPGSIDSLSRDTGILNVSPATPSRPTPGE